MNNLWTEKYRPATLDGYVFRDSVQKDQINSWIKSKTIPHLLLSGSAGVGKTTLAKILFNEIDVHEYDLLELNGSRNNGVDEVRNTVMRFIERMPYGPFKIILLDEADYLSKNAQAALRGVMEEYHETARFVLTCNYPHLIIPAIHSRCQGFHIENVDKVEFTARIATILMTEDVEFDLETLDSFVRGTYPDLRKCINTVQMNSIDKVLKIPVTNDSNISDYRLEMVELFKAGKISDARKLLCKSARPEEMEEIYRWLYDNIEIFGDEDKQNKAILIIKQALVDHTLISDSEINLSACLIRLSHLWNKNLN